MNRAAAVAVVFLTIGVVQAQSATASTQFAVTRKAADVYAIRSGEGLLLTLGCNVHALMTPARLDKELGRHVLVFGVPELARCRLLDRLRPARLAAGRYSVRLTLDDEDWYWIQGTGQRLRTVGCQRLAHLEPAVLLQASDGSGVVEFASGNACAADGVFFSTMQLRARPQSFVLPNPARHIVARAIPAIHPAKRG